MQTDTPPHAHAPAAGRRYCKFDEGGTQYQGLCDPTNGHCYDVYKYDMAVAKMRVRSRLAKGRGQSRGRADACACKHLPIGRFQPVPKASTLRPRGKPFNYLPSRSI